ncbi:MAG: hypothetical protein ACRD2A_07150 [Vicinamibacterales bacterium]
MIRTAFALVSDLLYLLRLMCRSRAQLAAENRFLRKQLAYYVERRVRRRRADNASRIALVLLSRLVEWRDLLTIVRPDTGGRWHRSCFDCSGAQSHDDVVVPVFPLICSDSSQTWQQPIAPVVRSVSPRSYG